MVILSRSEDLAHDASPSGSPDAPCPTTYGSPMLTIAIQPDNHLLSSGRRQSFSNRWIELLPALGHEARVVDAYKPNLGEQLAGCDAFMWWFGQTPRAAGQRVVSAVAHGLGMPTFPARATFWHFEDKIAQSYLLELAGIPMPRTWVFWRRKNALAFCQGAAYPLVLKLSTGVISENVRILQSFAEARTWIDALFGGGLFSLEQPFALQGQPPTRWSRSMRNRLVAASRLVVRGDTRRPKPREELQKNYLLVQEFLPGNESDLRVAIIGHRAFAFTRFNRPGDFRASGSGLRSGDPAGIDRDAIRLAFRVSRRLGTPEIGVDVLRREGEPVIAEISYYYEAWILAEECPGHWELRGEPETGDLEWVDGPLRPEDAVLEDFLERVPARAAANK